MGVLLTQRDRFFEKELFCQLVFQGLQGIPSHALPAGSPDLIRLQGSAGMPPISSIKLPPPAILKPRQLWTGKQIVSAILAAMTGGFAAPADTFSADCKAKVGAAMWLGRGQDETRPVQTVGVVADDFELATVSSSTDRSLRKLEGVKLSMSEAQLNYGSDMGTRTTLLEHEGDHHVVVRESEFLVGVLDKATLGNSSFGIIHCLFELYGPDVANSAIASLGRLLTAYLQIAAVSCGLDDLCLSPLGDSGRTALVARAYADGAAAAAEFAGLGFVEHSK